MLDHRYAGLNDPTFTQGPGGVRRSSASPFQGCTGESCYGTEGGAGAGGTPLPRQGAAQAMLAHRYGRNG
jgi:hypothetical protein